MEKIKKIILSLHDPKNIKRILIIKTNGIERYTSETLSQSELKEIYSNYVLELKNDNQELLDGLNNQQKINKLAKLGKIERNENNLIISVIYFENENKVIIYYEDGTFEEKIISKSNFIILVSELCKIYNIPFDKKNYDKTISILKEKGLIKIRNNEIKKVIKNNKIKNLKINRRVLSSLIALSMVGGIFVGVRLINKEIKNNSEDKKTQTDIYLPKITPSIDLTNEFMLNKKLNNVIEKINNYLNENEIIYDALKYSINNYNNVKDGINNLGYNIYNFSNNFIDQYQNSLDPYNFLNKLNLSKNLTTLNINNDQFVIIQTKKGYLKILEEEGKQEEDDCFECAIAYSDAIFADSESFSITGERVDRNVVVTENEQRLMQIMAKELLEGRTSVIRVNGPKGGRHFVLVVGIRKNYNKNNLKQSDFLIADPATCSLKILDTEFGGQRRYLLKAEDDKNWQGREGDSLGYMIALANNYEEYITVDVEKGIVPWVTYAPKER